MAPTSRSIRPEPTREPIEAGGSSRATASPVTRSSVWTQVASLVEPVAAPVFAPVDALVAAPGFDPVSAIPAG